MLNRRRTVIHVFVFLFSIVFSACTSQATTQPFTQTPQPTKQSTVEINTPTNIPAILEPSPTFTAIEKPTRTPTFLHRLTNTPTVSPPTNTPTVTTQTMLTEQALALKETQIAGFSVTCDDLVVSNFSGFFTSLSPKGNWLAISCMERENRTLKIVSKTRKKWVLQFKDYVDKQEFENGQFPRGTLYPVSWSSDERYLYFRSTMSISAGGTCFYGGWGQGLYRLNVDNGTVTATLPPLKGGNLYIFSFSPSGRWLAYTEGVPTILDLLTGENITLQEGRNSVGDFAWSPDSSNLIYGTCQPSEDGSTSEKSSIRIFSLKTREAKTILETKTGFLRIESGEDNILKIYDEYSNNRPSYLYFDWSTQQVITPTVTPTP